MGSTANQLPTATATATGPHGAVASQGLAAIASTGSARTPSDGALLGGGGGDVDPRPALHRLAALRDRMDAIRRRVTASLSGELRPLSAAEIHSVSSEIASSAHLVVLNAASLLALPPPAPAPASSPVHVPAPTHPPAPAPATIQQLPAAAASPQERPEMAAMGDGGYNIVELDADELLAVETHCCKICDKKFYSDAYLRMHMHAHGHRFKTLEAFHRSGLPKPPGGREVRFSCPFKGCDRNRAHPRFRPLKTEAFVRYHFRRSHCPKIYPCMRCSGKKRFAVLSDLRSHLSHCGKKVQWRCSCGAIFSLRDMLSSHLARFEGHRPAITEPNKEVVAERAEALLKPMEGVEGNAGREEDEEVGNDPELLKESMEFRGDAGGSSSTEPAAAGQ